MKRKRYSEEQIVRVLEEASSGTPVTEVCRKYNISNPTFYEWKKKYGGMSASDVRELRAVKEENQRLKRLLAERDLEVDALKDVIEKSCNACCTKRAGEVRAERVFAVRAAGVSIDESFQGIDEVPEKK